MLQLYLWNVKCFFLASPTGLAWLDVSSQTNCQDQTRNVSRANLLSSLLLLLFLLLSLAFILLCWGFLNRCRGRFFSFGFFLDSNKEADDILGLGHLVSPGHESMLEHLGVDLAFLVVSLESLDDEVIRVISISSHLLLEHLDHVVIGAGTSNLTKETIKFSLTHEDTNVVKSTTEVVFVNGTILIDVHKLEAVLVHLELLLGEATFILSLAHLGYELLLLLGSEHSCTRTASSL